MSYGNQFPPQRHDDSHIPPSRTGPGAGSVIGTLMRNPALMRLVIAGAIALFAYVGYISRTETNPVTGETQRVGLNPDQEMALGLQAAPEMLRDMGGGIDPRQDPRARLISEVGLKLVYSSEAQKTPYAIKRNFNFFLLNDTKTINAFALPGGQIFITRALFDRLENEAQLAGVLGHEIGHVVHRHGAERMAQQQLNQGLLGAVAVGAGGDQSMTQIAKMVSNFRLLSYGRDDELESDAWGLKSMMECGYDPAQMIGVMKILAQATGSGPRGNEWGSSHPHPETRIEAIKAFLEENKELLRSKQLSKGQPFR